MDRIDIIIKLEERLKKINKEVIIDWSPYKEGISYNSREILPLPNKDIKETLKKIFNLEIKNWDKFFEAATNGSGQEINRIMKLHSSALLALLCFSNVSDKKPIWIDNIKYVKSWFEIQNKVFENPSSIDIVLKSENGDLLFLESKFTEYLHTGNPNIRMDYFDFYKKLFPQIPDTPIQIVYPKIFTYKGTSVTGLTIKPKSESIKYENLYLEGIKQCLSHIIGICKGPQNKDEECWQNIKNNATLTFASIIYKLKDPRFSTYADFYKISIGKITSQLIEDSFTEPLNHVHQLHIRPKILTYQEVFKDQRNKILNKEISNFYNL